MAGMNKRVNDALARVYGEGRLPDVVDLAVGQRVFDAIAAQQGGPVWSLKWAGPVRVPAGPLSAPVTEWSPRTRIDPTTIYLHLTDDDPDECEVVRDP